MKRNFNIIAVVIMLGMVLLLSGCGEKRVELKFQGEEGTIVFKVKKKAGYKISTNKDDFRTSREQAVIIGNDFKIGIEFSDNLSYFYNSDFDKIKEERKDELEYKEVTYSKIKGIQYFYGAYNRYNIVLPCKDSDDYYLSLYVYNKDNIESAKAAMNNKEVLDILNHIESITTIK